MVIVDSSGSTAPADPTFTSGGPMGTTCITRSWSGRSLIPVARGVRAGTCLVLIALATTACEPAGQLVVPPTPPSRPDQPVLHQNGFEGLTVRRDVADVSIPDLMAFLPPGDDIVQRGETENCGVAERADLGLIAMTDGDLAVRAFVVSSEDAATPEGIHVGSSHEEVRTAYGDAVLYDEPAEDGSRLLVVDDQERPDQDLSLASQLFAFDLDASGAVTTLRAGGFPWLLGCAAGRGELPDTVRDLDDVTDLTDLTDLHLTDLTDLTATFFGVGDVPIGGTVEQAETALGVELGAVEPIEDGCGLARSTSGEVAVVVVDPGGVQAVVVATDAIPFVSGGEHVGVGSTEEDVRGSMPRWTGGDSEVSLAGGERIVVTPREVVGYALLLEADPSGRVVQYRVGVDDYVLQVDYC